ncbi:MAG: hypothetical protein CVU39_12455 [Chloroflexi bacterium HGW-Chloroflexi-10]|nr:MAG: hypothetical protein CVU39_12455 [Chloroflexi bacterium HGW-Chloroflexi-10]
MMTIEELLTFLRETTWLWYFLRILLFFLVALSIHGLSGKLVRPMTALLRLSPRERMKPERGKTLTSLIASGISMTGFLFAMIASVGLFVSNESLVWMVGLFSAAFGLAARPIISDVMTGIGFIFEDTFAVGDKVEILGIEGVIEAINLRTTLLRAPSGELYVIPNGEIRTLRNFSRGRFSTTNVHLNISAGDLNTVLTILEDLSKEAVELLPNLLEPWQVISEKGVMGQQTQLTLLSKTRFGKAAEMRPRLLALLQERLAEAGIKLVD